MSSGKRTVPRSGYYAYLKSPEWAAVRRRYRQSKLPQICLGCGEPKVEFHHKSYNRLGNERLMDIIPVCRSCHQAIHDTSTGHAVLWKTSNRVLKRIRRKTGHEAKSRGPPSAVRH